MNALSFLVRGTVLCAPAGKSLQCPLSTAPGGTGAAACFPDVDVSTGDCLFGRSDLDYEQILTLSSGADCAGVGRMLAYIFWHAPKPTAARADYERDLVAFSRALSDLNCPGVRRNSSFRISTVPWLDDPSGYEDWATVDGSYVLETLNEQAVSGSMAVLHGMVAQQMGVGYGGLYYHLWGNMDPHVAARAQWLSRPRGIEFRPVLEGISQTATAPVSVWRRFMVLGPGLEFVILGNASLELRIPDGWAAHRVTRTVLS